MTKISSFRIATGVLSMAALVKTSAFVIAVVVLGMTSSAQAGSFGQPCTTAPQSQWLSVDELQRKVEGLGYRVQKAKLKQSCGELYARDKSGNRVELFVDPASGKIVGQL
jgi:hypothetical protein